MRRRTATLVPVIAAAVLTSTPTAQAHEGSSYLYRKWVVQMSTWVLVAPPGCDLPCDEHGYQYDEMDRPIPGHQQGESWDCRYETFLAVPPGPADNAVAAVAGLANDALVAADAAVSPVIAAVEPYLPTGVDPGPKPPCP